MKINVLGCHGSELSHYGTCGFLIDHSVLIDGGTICSALSARAQARIHTILISHTHVDHIKGLPFLTESLFGRGRKTTMEIIGLKEAIAGLREHFFNDRLWPDFTRIPNPRAPFFKLRAVKEGEPVRVDGMTIRAFRVNHTVPCAGFLIKGKSGSILYSGDTHQTERIYQEAAKTRDLKAALIETSFPNALDALAKKTKHLTPDLLKREFGKIGKPGLPLYVYHMKPRYLGKIRQELMKLKIKKLRMLKDGAVITIR